MKRYLLPCVACIAVAVSAASAHCQERAQEPFELARLLRSQQDGIARGDSAAFLSYRTVLAKLAERLAQVPDEAWKDPRNVHAAVAIVLSGGDPHGLQRLANQVEGQDRTLVRAALAYGENRNAEAMELLADVDARKLDPSIAGHIALVQAELVVKKDRERALVLLGDARLLAPGTMIEETALRREVALAVEQTDADRFETATLRYLRRFPSSVHMGNFRRQLAVDVATRGMADDPARRSKLEATLEFLPPSERQDVYFNVAWEGLKGASVDVVRWAAANAVLLASEGSAQQLRSKLCEAAVLIVTDQFDKGLSTLEGIPAGRLSEEETALLAAAVRVAMQVRHEPKPAAADGERPPGAEEPQVVASVRSAIAQVDTMLGGGRK